LDTLSINTDQNVTIEFELASVFQRLTATFKTWLFTLGRNTLVDELRRINRWVWQTLDEEPLLGVEDEVLEFIEQADIQHQFDQALCTMPLLQREALMLQLEGFSLQQIADICQENAETIKSRLRFARNHLKQTLEVVS